MQSNYSRFFRIINVVVFMMIVSLLVVSCTSKEDNKNIGMDTKQEDINNDKVHNNDNSENQSEEDSETNIEGDEKGKESQQVDDTKDDNVNGNDESDGKDEVSPNEDKIPVEIDYQQVKPNEIAHIMVIMYHGIIDNPPYHVTEEQFIKDLTFMYENGYRLISMREYLDNNIQVEAGFTPIVLTFDDGLSSTFSLIEEDGKLIPKPGTAIEIIERFAKEHPDFGKTAALYINGGGIFEGAGTVEERLNWLVDNGYDLGNHTSTHAKLSKLSSREIMKEIGIVDQIIKNAVPDYTVDTLTYPHGLRPKKGLRNFIQEGEYDGVSYSYQVGIREGASGPNVPPIHIKFDPYNMPRARGSEGEAQDMWWFFEYYNKNTHRRYISDGNPDRVSILKEDEKYVNKEKLGDKELYLYEIE